MSRRLRDGVAMCLDAREIGWGRPDWNEVSDTAGELRWPTGAAPRWTLADGNKPRSQGV
jgi:hypothetical protein